MLQIQEVVDVGALREERKACPGVLGKEGHEDRGVGCERVQGEGILEFPEVERGGSELPPRNAIDFDQNLGQIDVYLDRGRELYARGSGQVAVPTAVRAEAVGREVPVVRAGVSLLFGETYRRLQLPEHEGVLPGPMKTERVSPAQLQSAMRRVEAFFHGRFGIESAYALDEPLSFGRGDAASSQVDALDLKVGRPDRFIVLGPEWTEYGRSEYVTPVAAELVHALSPGLLALR